MQTQLKTPSDSPYSLDGLTTYLMWRERKLATRPDPRPVDIGALEAPSSGELAALARHWQTHNFALFRVTRQPADTAAALRGLGRRLGLLDLDQNLCAEQSGVTEITVKRTDTDHIYIPYTSRPLGWHTDGYYNAGPDQIHAWLLYCAQPAAEGGSNGLLDHEIAYIRLRDQNPEWIRALMADDAFTIPGNTENGEMIRPDHSGPVFSVSPVDGSLHMRYSARQRNVVWKDDMRTREAAAYLLDLLDGDEPYVLRHRLAAGEGVISNNILHRRDGFRDDTEAGVKRLIYRARYYQRLPDTTEN